MHNGECLVGSHQAFHSIISERFWTEVTGSWYMLQRGQRQPVSSQSSQKVGAEHLTPSHAGFGCDIGSMKCTVYKTFYTPAVNPVPCIFIRYIPSFFSSKFLRISCFDFPPNSLLRRVPNCCAYFKFHHNL